MLRQGVAHTKGAPQQLALIQVDQSPVIALPDQDQDLLRRMDPAVSICAVNSQHPQQQLTAAIEDGDQGT